MISIHWKKCVFIFDIIYVAHPSSQNNYHRIDVILLFKNCHLWRGESNKGENSFFFLHVLNRLVLEIFFFIIYNYYPSFNSQSFPCMLGKLAVINHTLNEKKNEMHPKPFFTKRRKVDAKYSKTCNKFVLFYSLSHKHDV